MLTKLIAPPLLALTLTACSSGGTSTDVVAENLRAQEQAQQALRERITEIEDRLDEQGTPDPTGQVEALTTQLADVSQAVQALRAELEQRTGTNEEAGVALRADLGEVAEQLDLLAETLSGVSSDVTALESDLAELRETVERHLDSHD